MGRPRKPEIGSEKWARAELKTAEKRLRDVRRLIASAADDDLPGLLRLEAALRRELERLARLARPSPAFELPGYDLRELERALAGGQEDSD